MAMNPKLRAEIDKYGNRAVAEKYAASIKKTMAKSKALKGK